MVKVVEPDEHMNQVVIRGRLATDAVERELPSGDVVATFRVVVDRGSRARTGGPTVDTIDCAAWRADVRRSIARAEPGDVVEVDGSLRRRFWRAPNGAASRYEVEVSRVRRQR